MDIKFKLWLENSENNEINDLLQKLDASSTDKIPFDEFKNLYEEAMKSEYLTKDQYRNLKIKLEKFLNFSTTGKLPDYVYYYMRQKEEENQEKAKKLRDQGISYDWGDISKPKEPFDKFIYSLSSVNLIGQFKIISKKSNQQFIDLLPEDVKEDCNKMRKFLDPYIKIKDKIDDLKSKVKSPAELRSMKKAEIEEKKKRDYFSKPLASLNAIKKLEESIDDVLAKNKENFIKEDKQRLLKIADRYFDEFKKDPSSVRNIKMLFNHKIINLFSWNRGSHNEILNLQKKPDHDMIANKMAEDEWNSMSRFFKSRMINKISPIVDKKGEDNNDFEMKIINFNTYHGILEGEFSFKFTDNSSFTVKHQVVGKYSITGKYFNQFPTHFKNIKTADGTSYNSLAEDAMYLKFVNISPPKDISEYY